MRLQSYLFQHQLYRLDDLPVLMLPIPVRVLEELGATWEDVQALSNQLLSLEGGPPVYRSDRVRPHGDAA